MGAYFLSKFCVVDLANFIFQGSSPKGDWSQPPNLEDLAAKEGTLKDAQKIADKVSERVPPRVPFEGQQFGANFCAFCDGTPRHSPHECPARSVKVSCELSLYLIRTLTFRLFRLIVLVHRAWPNTRSAPSLV